MKWIYIPQQKASKAVTGSLLGMGINGFVIKDAKDFQDFLDDKDGNWDYIDDDLMDLKNM